MTISTALEKKIDGRNAQIEFRLAAASQEPWEWENEEYECSGCLSGGGCMGHDTGVPIEWCRQCAEGSIEICDEGGPLKLVAQMSHPQQEIV